MQKHFFEGVCRQWRTQKIFMGVGSGSYVGH